MALSKSYKVSGMVIVYSHGRNIARTQKGLLNILSLVTSVNSIH